MEQVAVIGLGVFGATVARALSQKGVDVIAIDSSAEIAQRLRDEVSQVVIAEATDEDAMKAAGLRDVDAAVVALGESLEASVLATAILRSFEVETIVARATNPLHGRILEQLGATRIVFPEQEIAGRVAHQLLDRNILEYVSLADDFVVAEVEAPADLVDRSLGEIRFRNTYGITVVAMRHRAPDEGAQDERHYFVPDPDDIVRSGDALLLAGRKERVEKFVEQ